MAISKKSDTITIDLEVLLIPLAIILASIMISASIVYAFRDGVTTTGTANNNTTVTATGGGSVASIVEEIDVNLDEFNACIDNNDFKAEIEKDLSDGSSAGISGTPGFIIGNLDSDGNVSGAVVSGAQPFNVFSDAINSYLDGKGENTAKVSIDDDPIKGNRDNAKVAIVEFSDFECPFCQKFHGETYDQIISEFIDSGKAIYVYRDYPLSFHEPKASEASIAASCVKQIAGDDKFYEFSKIYYERTLSNGEGLPS